jgi:hypothetical protein
MRDGENLPCIHSIQGRNSDPAQVRQHSLYQLPFLISQLPRLRYLALVYPTVYGPMDDFYTAHRNGLRDFDLQLPIQELILRFDLDAPELDIAAAWVSRCRSLRVYQGPVDDNITRLLAYRPFLHAMGQLASMQSAETPLINLKKVLRTVKSLRKICMEDPSSHSVPYGETRYNIPDAETMELFRAFDLDEEYGEVLLLNRETRDKAFTSWDLEEASTFRRRLWELVRLTQEKYVSI